MQPDVQLRLLRRRAPIRPSQPESQGRQVPLRHRSPDRRRQGEDHSGVRGQPRQERYRGGGVPVGVRDLRGEVQERRRGAGAGELRLRLRARRCGPGVRQHMRQALHPAEPRHGVPGGDGQKRG
ncbi:hypothetical protein MUK42_23750 [Musa troglodytarum]|uniref:Uncharacterized protein n=1 Tax=Musa troglodytarum TaxID=320322 RepID=A0A9E7G9B2_9LILI|nr:hypothetical protein MUK42_23750 [Musa troglodytarum]